VAHPLFTHASPTIDTPAQRASLFGKVTGAFKRGPATPAAPEVPDLRRMEHRRPAEAAAEPAPQVRAALTEPDQGGLDIPAFLRRQSS
jgi:cell division protein FtsZ